jgi:hypothetical protein
VAVRKFNGYYHLPAETEKITSTCRSNGVFDKIGTWNRLSEYDSLSHNIKENKITHHNFFFAIIFERTNN